MSRFDTPESEEYRKKQRQQETSLPDWRDSSRITDLDASFKAVVKAEKLRRESQIKQASTPLTQQQINERIARMDIIQQDVKAGTYNDPNTN